VHRSSADGANTYEIRVLHESDKSDGVSVQCRCTRMVVWQNKVSPEGRHIVGNALERLCGQASNGVIAALIDSGIARAIKPQRS